MSKNGYRVIDSDLHLMEPPDLFERYMDTSFRDKAPETHGKGRRPLCQMDAGGQPHTSLGP